MTTDVETLYELGTDPAAARAAIDEGRLRADGDPEAVARCTAIFLPRPGSGLLADTALASAERS